MKPKNISFVVIATGISSVSLDVSKVLAQSQFTAEFSGQSRVENRFQRGLYELERGNYQEAIEWFDKVYPQRFQAIERSSSPLTNQGIAYQELGDYQSANDSYQESIITDPSNGLPYLNLGVLYYEQGNFEDARTYFHASILLFEQRLRSLSANSELVEVERCRYSLMAADYNPRVEQIKIFLATAYRNRAYIYQAQNRYDEAICDYSKSIAYNPNDAFNYLNRGILSYKENYLEQAIEDLENAINISPQLSEAYNSLGVIYLNQGRVEEAIYRLDQAISIESSNIQFYYNRGVAYYYLSREGIDNEVADDSIADFQKSINLASSNLQDNRELVSAAYNNLGVIYFNQNRLQEAIDAFSQAVSINPENIEARNNLQGLAREHVTFVPSP